MAAAQIYTALKISALILFSNRTKADGLLFAFVLNQVPLAFRIGFILLEFQICADALEGSKVIRSLRLWGDSLSPTKV